MTINVRNKGAQGEREAAKWLKKILSLDYLPERNLEQYRKSDYDLFVPPFLIEVKRQQNLSLRSWWKQITDASCNYKDVTPIVLFRQNRKKWKCLVPFNGSFCQLENFETITYLRKEYGRYKNQQD